MDDEICEDEKGGEISQTMNQFNEKITFDMTKLNKKAQHQ